MILRLQMKAHEKKLPPFSLLHFHIIVDTGRCSVSFYSVTRNFNQSQQIFNRSSLLKLLCIRKNKVMISLNWFTESKVLLCYSVKTLVIKFCKFCTIQLYPLATALITNLQL